MEAGSGKMSRNRCKDFLDIISDCLCNFLSVEEDGHALASVSCTLSSSGLYRSLLILLLMPIARGNKQPPTKREPNPIRLQNFIMRSCSARA